MASAYQLDLPGFEPALRWSPVPAPCPGPAVAFLSADDLDFEGETWSDSESSLLDDAPLLVAGVAVVALWRVRLELAYAASCAAVGFQRDPLDRYGSAAVFSTAEPCGVPGVLHRLRVVRGVAS